MTILVDSHVHIHDCFDLKAFFHIAHSNFVAAAAELNGADSFQAVLLLAETPQENWFERLANSALRPCGEPKESIGDWRLCLTKEDCSLILQRDEQQRLILIAGRQITTQEHLEVLALGTAEKFLSGLPLQEAIQAIREGGGVPVIPWGFGKWTGRRRRAVCALFQTFHGTDLFVGDNGGRPALLPHPTVFHLAKQRGIRVLPGSDPLPFPWEAHRVGSFGLWIRRWLSLSHPARDLRSIFFAADTSIHAYGNLAGIHRFLGNQLRLRIGKWRSRQ